MLKFKNAKLIAILFVYDYFLEVALLKLFSYIFDENYSALSCLTVFIEEIDSSAFPPAIE
jgi:hypothetical protein